jgi:hypothetical protein
MATWQTIGEIIQVSTDRTDSKRIHPPIDTFAKSGSQSAKSIEVSLSS